MTTTSTRTVSARVAAVTAAAVLSLSACSDPAQPEVANHTTSSIVAPTSTPMSGDNHLAVEDMLLYQSASDSDTATVAVTGPGRAEPESVVTIPGNSYDKIVRYSRGFVAVGKKGLTLLDESAQPAGSIEVKGINNLTGWTTSPSGHRTALVLNTGDGRFPDAQTVVSIDSDTSTNFAVSTHSYPAALTQCDNGALKWLEPVPGQPPVGADSPVALDLVTATTPEQIKRIHLPAAPFPVFGAIDCATNTASYLSLSDSPDTTTGIVITNPGPTAAITRSIVDGSVSNRDTTGGVRTTTAFADQHGGLHQFGPDGILESWWFTPSGVTHEHTDTGLGGATLAGTTFTGEQAVIWHATEPGHATVQVVDVKKPECHSAPATVPIIGDATDITSMVPATSAPMECTQP